MLQFFCGTTINYCSNRTSGGMHPEGLRGSMEVLYRQVHNLLPLQLAFCHQMFFIFFISGHMVQHY